MSCECDPNRNLGLITSLPPKLAFLDRIVTELNGILRFRTLYLILQQRLNKCSICIHPLNLGPCHMVFQLGCTEHSVTYKGLPQPEFSWDGLHRPWIPENVNHHIWTVWGKIVAKAYYDLSTFKFTLINVDQSLSNSTFYWVLCLKKVRKNCCNTETVHIWPHVSNPKMCLRGGIFFSLKIVKQTAEKM